MFRRVYTGANELRLRVNDPLVSLDERWGRRVEASEAGFAVIEIDTDLFEVTSARVRMELWGGHPGTAGKRVTINGRGTYLLPESGTALGHCTYSDAVVPIEVGDLVRGANALQFGCDRGDSFWGHYIIDNLCIELEYAGRDAATSPRPRGPIVGLDTEGKAGNGPVFAWSPEADRAVADGTLLRADLFASHQGVRLPLDGEGQRTESRPRGFARRGFMRGRRWHGHLGTLTAGAPRLPWDLSRLPVDCDEVSILGELTCAEGVHAVVPVYTGAVPGDPTHRREVFFPVEQPRPFWSREGAPMTARFVLDRIEGARWTLQVRFWHGGWEGPSPHLTINGRPFNLLEAGAPHDLRFYDAPVDSALLRKGENTLTLVSESQHHGVELLYPGPVLLRQNWV